MIRRIVAVLTIWAAPIIMTPAVSAQALAVTTPADMATKAEVAAVDARICAAGSTAPQAEAVQASAGAAATCLRSDAKLPRITRAGLISSTTSNGDWSITWSTPLPAAPVTLPIPMNTGTQPIVCNVATSTATGASGRCWLARTLPATLVTLTALVSFDPNGAPAAGIQVQVLAIPTTQ